MGACSRCGGSDRAYPTMPWLAVPCPECGRRPGELSNPPWVGAVAVIGSLLVSVAIVLLLAVMWK